MTRYFLRLPGHATVDDALGYQRAIGAAVLEAGIDGSVRGSVEVAAMSSRARAIKAVCDYYRISLRCLLARATPGAGSPTSGPRFVAMWLLHRWAGLSYPETARALGLTNHTSAIYGVRVVEDDPRLWLAAWGIRGWLDGERGRERRAA